MSSFVKIWTDIRNDPWFIGLKLSERGLWYELLTLAKIRGDSGRFWFRSKLSLAQEVGGDDSSVRRILGKFRHDGKISMTELENSAIEITIPKYSYWQELTKDGAKKSVAKNRRETSGKPSLAEQIRAEQSREQTEKFPDSFFDEIITHYNLKTKRDWVLDDEKIGMLKSRLKKFTVEQLKEAIDGITTRPYNLGQNQDNHEYLDFELIFKSDSQVDKYRQDVIGRKKRSEKSAVDQPPISLTLTPEQQAAADAEKSKFFETIKEKGLMRQ